MTRLFDVAVAGLGAMGGCATYALARRGRSVIGFDRFNPPHAFGSTPGTTRVIREAYYEHPQYVPLVQRAYDCWSEAEALTGETLWIKTGGLMIGDPNGILVAGARTSATQYGLPYEELSASDIQRRFPLFRPASWMGGIWEPRAGLLFPDRCIAAYLELARRHGASLHVDEPVVRWSADGEGVRIVTARGEYVAEQLVLACGAWMPTMLDASTVPLEVERTVQHWFAPAANADQFRPDRFPVFLFEYEPPNSLFYGFPDTGDGVKVARHHQGRVTTADTIDREVQPFEVERMRELVREFLPDADGPLLRSAVCMYTNTPDHDFIIDRHPQHSNVIIVSPCSGHGFKFSSAIGEVVAELAIDGHTTFDLAPFSVSRFG